jgi:probable F420-dependent oxidoreductase, Rv2161c family
VTAAVSEVAPGLTIGLVVGNESRATIEHLETQAIDSLWAGGHIAANTPGSEAMGSLIRLGALTERVRVGTAILLLPLYPPAIVAKQVGDLDLLTGGRVTLGVGIGGEYPQEFRACDVPRSERGRRTDEAISLLRRLWTGEPVTHHGRFYPMEEVQLHPAPLRPPPIVVAGRQEPAMRRAALLGDGWMPYLYSARRYAESTLTIRQYAMEAGRDLHDFEWYAYLFVNCDPDGDRAKNAAAGHLGGAYGQDLNEMIEKVAVVGTPDRCVERIQEYVDAGARHLVFYVASSDDKNLTRRRLLDEVLPRIVVP